MYTYNYSKLRKRRLSHCTCIKCRVLVAYAVVVFTVLMVLATWHSAAILKFKDNLTYSLSKTMFHNFDEPTDSTTLDAPHLTVRSVYVDSRQHAGQVTFLIEVKKSILNLSQGSIMGCRVGKHFTRKFTTRVLYTNGPLAGLFVDDKPYLTHTMAVVDCFGLSSVQNGSNSSLVYTNPSGFILPAESERPLLILPQLLEENQPYRILCCTAVLYGRPPFLKDWLTYQKVIGVDHVYMIATDEFQDMNESYIMRAISEGFLTVEIWQEYLQSDVDIRYHSQLLAYQDCIYRYRQSYDYVMMTDQDDFFVPLVPNVTLRYYIDRWCSGKGEGTCAFHWREYHPDCGMRDGPAVNGNLTSLLVSTRTIERSSHKCIHKLSAVREIGVHKAREYKKGYDEARVPKEVAYVAHLRQFDQKHHLRQGNC